MDPAAVAAAGSAGDEGSFVRGEFCGEALFRQGYDPGSQGAQGCCIAARSQPGDGCCGNFIGKTKKIEGSRCHMRFAVSIPSIQRGIRGDDAPAGW